MNTKQLYYFTVIAESGSFTAAAKTLELSQPPLSKQIMALEEELGLQLMNRNSRQIELTEAGAFLYSRSKSILSMVESTVLQIQNLKSSAGGTLKLGTISSSGNMLMNNFLKGFCQDFPQVKFEITEGNTYELLEKLKNGIIECAIVRTPFNGEGFECVYGQEESLTAVGDEKYFKNLTSNQINLTDLAGIPLIYYRRFESIISLAFQNIGIEPNIFCRNDDARTSLIWADTGLGVALVPESISKLSLASHMTVKLIDSEDTITRMAAIYKKNGYVSHIAREFTEYFKNYFEQFSNQTG